MATVTKTKEIEIARRSSKMLRYRLPDVPSGATVVKAYLYVKAMQSTADEDAMLVKTILPGFSVEGAITGQGLIVDDGATDNDARLCFIIGNTDLDDFELNKPYWLAVKVILSNGNAVMPPASRTVLRVLPAIINAIV
ncbi:MAG: hypothetical protein EOP06_00570 [Proteobacteria bacterium]|nr:MAG: hypothetical protein EOP06_00570 [Pseudomonadota bacterium]